MTVPVLKQLDILIGLAVVMLLVSTAVTAIVQVLLTSSFARSRHLRDGLQELIAQIDPLLLSDHKHYIAQRIQRHPLVSRGNTPLGWASGWFRNLLRRTRRGVPGLPGANPAAVIQREELVLILLEWAAGDGPMAAQDRELVRARAADAVVLDAVRGALKTALARSGISSPGAVIAQVRQLALDQEAANPQLPAAQWRAQAVLQGAGSPFTAKIFSWFDNTVSRVSGNFALEARWLTCVVGFLVCWGIQLDSIQLVNQLAKDDKLRSQLVAQADQALKRYDELKSQTEVPQKQLAEATKAELGRLTKELQSPEIGVIPNTEGRPMELTLGMIFSGILVGLGAPFWYDLLKRLLGLRSLLAQKDDSERKSRQESQQPETATPPAPASRPAVLSDQPDLVLIKTATSLRSGAPNGTAPSAGEVAADTLVPVTGAVEGQEMPTGQGTSSKKWFRTMDGFYLWAGATDKP
jgi:hypothetical protein